MKNFKKILEEYAPNILEDTDEIMNLKLRLRKLSPSDFNLMILYADLGSMDKTAKVLGVSTYTVWVNVNRIRKILVNDIH